jgi:hypothetical protein
MVRLKGAGQFDYRKTRYLSLIKNTADLIILFALSNLCMMEM